MMLKNLMPAVGCLFFLAACGGSGGSKNNTLGGSSISSSIISSTANSIASSAANSTASSNGVSDINPPSAFITFPTPVSMTESGSVLIRGSASDDKSKISSVKVNGYEASTTDNYSTWKVSVPLNQGVNNLSVSVIDAAGNTAANAAEIKIARKVLFSKPRSIRIDTDNNRALVIDAELKALIAVDLGTGVRTIFSDNSLASGSNLFSDPVCITVDTKNNRALVLDDGYGVKALFSVDLTTGTRTIITTYNYSDLNSPKGMALDESNSRVLITASQSVVSINLENGVKSVVSNNSTPGSKYYLTGLTDIVIDKLNNRALVTDSGNGGGKLVSIDLKNGATYGVAELLSSDSNFSIGGLTLNKASTKAFITHGGEQNKAGYVSVVDLTSDPITQTTLSDGKIPNELNQLRLPRSIAFDESKNRALVVDEASKSVVAIDLTNGERTPLSDNGIPTGTISYANPLNLFFDSNNNRLFLMEEYPTTLYALDLNTSSQTIISKIDENHGANNYHGIVLDASQNRMLIADSALGGIAAIDMNSGARNMFWSGNNFSSVFPLGIALDKSENRIIVNDAYECITSINLTNGISSVVSNNTTPNAINPISCMSPIAIDSSNNRVLSLEYNTKMVIAIDLTTGNRTILSSNNKPDTINPFSSPISITVDTKHNRALVLDGGGIIGVNLGTGKRTLVSEDFDAYAPTITVDEIRNIAFLVNNRLRAVIAVDLDTGERVILSK